MRCPNCKTEISLLDVGMTEHYDSDGIQIRFECPECMNDYFAILTPKTFVEVP